jgi:hypothetical protein
MFSIIGTQPLELQIPAFLIGVRLGSKVETYFGEPHISFRVHFASFEDSTLTVDPNAQ